MKKLLKKLIIAILPKKAISYELHGLSNKVKNNDKSVVVKRVLKDGTRIVL